MRWAVLFLAVLLNSAANILLKAGTRKLESIESFHPNIIWKFLTNGYFVAGVFCFGLALISYSLALTKFELSVAYPIMTGVGFVIVGITSYVWFREQIGTIGIAGIVFITIGIILVARDAG